MNSHVSLHDASCVLCRYPIHTGEVIAAGKLNKTQMTFQPASN